MEKEKMENAIIPESTSRRTPQEPTPTPAPTTIDSDKEELARLIEEKNMWSKKPNNCKDCKKQTPNCMICKWRTSLNSIFTTMGDHRSCGAQGYIQCEDAYNTDECKSLYESEESES